VSDLTAADVAAAPRADEASGQMAPGDGPSLGRRAAKIALFVPRWTAWAAFAPLRLGLWGYERSGLALRLSALFSGPGNLFAHPVARYDSEFGYAFGARVVARDLFGAGEQARLKASLGGDFDQFYALRLGSGERFRPLRVVFDIDAKKENKARFAGIGNRSLVSDCPTGATAGPDEVACATRFAQDVLRVELAGELRLIDRLMVSVSSAMVAREFASTDSDRDPDLASVYDPVQLVGYDAGLQNVYSELGLTYDDREAGSEYVSTAVPSTGWSASLFSGYQTGVRDDPSNFFRAGFDVQRFVSVRSDDRIVALRLYGEAVSGDLDDDVPFVDLPSLGGKRLLRGFGTARFRDRGLLTGSAEYDFPIQHYASGFVFVDGGRVYRGLRDLTLDDLHVGYGGGFQFHTPQLFLMRLQMAYSHEENDFHIALTFEPIFRAQPRSRRY
jgi:hypothetical protein